MILQVHDELVFEVSEEEIEEATRLVKQEMEGVFTLSEPLVVEGKSGRSRAEAH